MKASKTLKEVLKKHHFRNKLSKAIKSREQIVKFFYNNAFVSKMRKHMMASVIASRIQSLAFNRARERIDGKAAWEIQRAIRGHWARSKGDRTEWVQ
jgi:hypothetical protein